MPMHIFRFESFELDRERRSLRQDGHAVAITPKAFDVLAMLVERHGQLVTKEEMLKTLWPDSFVEEGNLSVHISLLRKRLGDNAEDHRFILTIPGRGYQFVASVTEVAPVAAPAATVKPELVWRQDAPRSRRWRRWVAAAACLAAIAGSGWLLADGSRTRASQTERLEARVSPEAERLYQRGRYLLGKRTRESLRRGIAHFESALATDPEFALAYSGIADGYSMLGYFGFEAPRDVLPRARAAAGRALLLDPQSAAAHTSHAYILHRYEWQFAAAERSFMRAIELQPDYALARHWYGSFLESMTRYDEAIAQSAKAEQLEPVSPVISANLAGILSSARRPSLALAQWDKALELDQAFWPAHLVMAEIYAVRDMPQQALEAFQRSIELSGENPKQVAALARFHAESGRIVESRRLLNQLTDRAKNEWVSPADIASIHASLGNPDEAFKWLERAVQEQDPLVAYLPVSRYWKPLRRDPRYATMLERIGFSRAVIDSALAAHGT